VTADGGFKGSGPRTCPLPLVTPRRRCPGHLTPLKTIAVERTLPADDDQLPGMETRTYEHLPNDREVRLTVISTITRHLREPADGGAHISWQGHDLDFSGATFDGGAFSGATFDGGDFSGATFTGARVSFAGAQFTGDRVSFTEAQFTGAAVSFDNAPFIHGTVSFTKAQFTGATVSFTGAQFGDSLVNFDRAQFTKGAVSFDDVLFTGGVVTRDGVEFRGWPPPPDPGPEPAEDDAGYRALSCGRARSVAYLGPKRGGGGAVLSR